MKRILKSISLVLFVAAFFFVTGCTEKTAALGDEIVTQENVTIVKDQVVTKNDSGKTISVKSEDNFTLILRENPSTGYAWELNLSNGLTILCSNYSRDPAPQGYVGVPGNHSWVIQAIAPGSQQVNGIYKRNWENTTYTRDNFTLTVKID